MRWIEVSMKDALLHARDREWEKSSEGYGPGIYSGFIEHFSDGTKVFSESGEVEEGCPT